MANFKLNAPYEVSKLFTDFRFYIECEYDKQSCSLPCLDNGQLNILVNRIIESDKGLNIRYFVSDRVSIISLLLAFRDAIKITIKHKFEDEKTIVKEVYRKEFGNIEWQMISDTNSNDLLYLDIFVKCELDILDK